MLFCSQNVTHRYRSVNRFVQIFFLITEFIWSIFFTHSHISLYSKKMFSHFQMLIHSYNTYDPILFPYISTNIHSHTFSKASLNPYQLGSDSRCLIHPLLTVKQSAERFVPCLVQSPNSDVMSEECSWVRVSVCVCRTLELWCWGTDLKQYGQFFVYNGKLFFRVYLAGMLSI